MAQEQVLQQLIEQYTQTARRNRAIKVAVTGTQPDGLVAITLDVEDSGGETIRVVRVLDRQHVLLANFADTHVAGYAAMAGDGRERYFTIPLFEIIQAACFELLNEARITDDPDMYVLDGYREIAPDPSGAVEFFCYHKDGPLPAEGKLCPTRIPIRPHHKVLLRDGDETLKVLAVRCSCGRKYFRRVL